MASALNEVKRCINLRTHLGHTCNGWSIFTMHVNHQFFIACHGKAQVTFQANTSDCFSGRTKRRWSCKMLPISSDRHVHRSLITEQGEGGWVNVIDQLARPCQFHLRSSAWEHITIFLKSIHCKVYLLLHYRASIMRWKNVENVLPVHYNSANDIFCGQQNQIQTYWFMMVDT